MGLHAFRLGLLIVALAVSGRCAAQTDEGDPPGRVAVVDVIDGAAAVQPGGSGDWVSDLLNRPLTTGDRLWVDTSSRAEVHLGAAALRLGASTGLEFLNVGDQVAQLRLTAGSLNVRLRYLSPDETFEVDTPNTAVTLLQPGEYRIDVSDTGDAVAVAVWQGQAEVAGESQSYTLFASQQGQFQGTSQLGVAFGDLPPPDPLDQWAAGLDQREDAALSANFLSRDVTGYQELDSYGDWQTDPELGAVWVPQVDAGWSPYSEGYWAWVAPWGWTWVDARPWGFAPFHYGRWVHHGARWVWCPGQLSVRPVYAPALVVWSTGAGGRVGWFPLGYNEVYRPSRHVSDAYLQRVNVTNTYLNNTVPIDGRNAAAPAHYANEAVPGATIVVPRETLTSALPVTRAAQAAAGVPLVRTISNPVLATPRSVHPLPHGGRPPAPPPVTLFARPAVARTTPPALAGQPAGARRVIVTAVPRAEALHRNYTTPVAAPAAATAVTTGPGARSGNTPAPAAARTPRTLPAPVAPPVPPAINEASGTSGAAQAYRQDRPPVMPHPANDRVLTPPAAVERERVEPGNRQQRAPVERPLQPAPAPPPRIITPPPAEPAHHAPVKAGDKN